ncbi:hypothetical protein RRG08_005393 [Elysia crispata]|uniref:Uncharacterized protein n=1 Tax=Elysia crispata TaxID=231223 RepID=A0AAE0XXZ1_9GAST|nr:hypothetical protein RRG08_005393 [Elysia crispata]
MDITCKSSWDLWVTLPNKNTITLLGVTPNGINIKTSLKTTKKYMAIAAVTTQTIAVGYTNSLGIDLIDLSGNILYQLSSTLNPFSMVTTADGYLIMSIVRDNSIAKLKLEDNSTVFRHKVQQIEKTRGVEFIMDGSFIIGDRDKRTLNLISPNGAWVKNLWTHPGVFHMILWDVTKNGAAVNFICPSKT